MKHSRLNPNVNVPLGKSQSEPDKIVGMSFPCPLCAVSLPVRIARTHKPYLVCLDCGIQLFVRGRVGIERLKRILEDKLLVAGSWSGANHPELLFNRIQHLKQRKAELKQKQRLLFPDPDLENAIHAIDNEIERVQGELEKLGRDSRSEVKS